MKHLINANVYDFGEECELIPDGDGIELLTGFSELKKEDFPKTVSVHLPYCVDWYGIWSGKRKLSPEINNESIPYFSYGRNRKEIIENISKSIAVASAMKPEYGVLHAGSANEMELFLRDYSETDEEILKAFCEIMNSVKDEIKIPFRIVFENQWWPGLRYLDSSGFEILKDNLDFGNWGMCLDTGHLLVTTKKSFEENDSVEMLKKLFESYPKEMVEKIDVVHLHTNYSGKYIGETEFRDIDNLNFDERLRKAYTHVNKMDWHIPFSSRKCTELVEILKPKFVTHEMGAVETNKKISDYLTQRNFFTR